MRNKCLPSIQANNLKRRKLYQSVSVLDIYRCSKLSHLDNIHSLASVSSESYFFTVKQHHEDHSPASTLTVRGQCSSVHRSSQNNPLLSKLSSQTQSVSTKQGIHLPSVSAAPHLPLLHLLSCLEETHLHRQEQQRVPGLQPGPQVLSQLDNRD